MKKVMCMVTLGLLLAGTASAADLTLSINRTDCGLAFYEFGAVYTFEVIGDLDTTSGDDAGLAAFGFDLMATLDGAPFNIAAVAVVEGGAAIATFDDGIGLNNPAGFGGTVIGDDLVQIGGAQNTIDNPGPNPPYPAGAPVLDLGHDPIVLATVTVTLAEADAGDYVFTVGNGFANVINAGQAGPDYMVTAVGTVVDGVLDAPENLCPWDLSQTDNAVTPYDVGFVKSNYGCAYGTGDCGCDRADLSGDQAVTSFDVGFVKSNYGDCP